MSRYVAQLERNRLEQIARAGIRRARENGVRVPRSLEREIKEVATTSRSFLLSDYGTRRGCRCLIGEVRFRRGESPSPEDGAYYDAEHELGILYDALVGDAVGFDDGNVKIV